MLQYELWSKIASLNSNCRSLRLAKVPETLSSITSWFSAHPRSRSVTLSELPFTETSGRPNLHLDCLNSFVCAVRQPQNKADRVEEALIGRHWAPCDCAIGRSLSGIRRQYMLEQSETPAAALPCCCTCCGCFNTSQSFPRTWIGMSSVQAVVVSGLALTPTARSNPTFHIQHGCQQAECKLRVELR